MSDSHWRNQAVVGSYKCVIFDYGFMFFLAVIVAGDCSGSDIHVFADFRVANIRKMIDFCSLADNAVFNFHKISNGNVIF